ncbi:unnamed protein product [Prorocentrum cordatum]|uniref:Uncharacterized protein n=1 Tax=Prorocentrum cordatum TaxID=2364126 RepID=A0ABN9Y0J2_9DINO|nr:unnamed protein product [Polarella glacialis]
MATCWYVSPTGTVPGGSPSLGFATLALRDTQGSHGAFKLVHLCRAPADFSLRLRTHARQGLVDSLSSLASSASLAQTCCQYWRCSRCTASSCCSFMHSRMVSKTWDRGSPLKLVPSSSIATAIFSAANDFFFAACARAASNRMERLGDLQGLDLLARLLGLVLCGVQLSLDVLELLLELHHLGVCLCLCFLCSTETAGGARAPPPAAGAGPGESSAGSRWPGSACQDAGEAPEEKEEGGAHEGNGGEREDDNEALASDAPSLMDGLRGVQEKLQDARGAMDLYKITRAEGAQMMDQLVRTPRRQDARRHRLGVGTLQREGAREGGGPPDETSLTRSSTQSCRTCTKPRWR